MNNIGTSSTRLIQYSSQTAPLTRDATRNHQPRGQRCRNTASLRSHSPQEAEATVDTGEEPPLKIRPRILQGSPRQGKRHSSTIHIEAVNTHPTREISI